MADIKSDIEKIASHFTDDYREPNATRIFFKAVVFYALIKLLLTWPLSRMIALHHMITFPRSIPGKILVGPAYLFSLNPDVFYVTAICVMILIIIIRPSFFTNIIFFWLTLNLYIINLPLANGSDIVLFILALWCIPLISRTVFKSQQAEVLQKTAYNLAFFCCQLQVVFIYLVSGMDKLLSEVWRSGDAFTYIRHLDYLYNPVLPHLFNNEVWDLVFSWATILFELLLVIFIWTKKFRVPFLIMGMIFHLFIWIVLSLPDFAVIMMISLLIFTKDSDYDRVKKWIRPSLPSG